MAHSDISARASAAGGEARGSPSAYDPKMIVREYLTFFLGLIDQIDIGAVCRAVTRLADTRDRGGTVYIAGNGGSAATAAHLANDLGKATKASGRRPFRVMSLAENVAWFTALANDEGYERTFTGQLENFARPGDALILISASGNSPNLVDAAEFSRAHGLVTIGLLGFDGGSLRRLVDEPIVIETEQGMYGPVETAHVLLCDLIATCLIRDRE